MDQPLISVVIPVYNKERYIDRCLKSLQEQTYKKIEMICIDDGSTDASYSICKKNAIDDKRIKVYTQKNRGAAESRNRGLELSLGDYLIFLDADDSFDSKMIEHAYNKILMYDADVVVWGYREIHVDFGEDNGEKILDIDEILPKDEVIEAQSIDFNIVERARTVPWNKMVKRKLIQENFIKFQNLPSENDVFFSNAVVLCANRIVFVAEALVNYYCGLAGSISESRINRKSHALLAYEQVYKYILQKRRDDKWAYLDKTLDWIWGNILKTDNDVRIRSIESCYKQCYELRAGFRQCIGNGQIKLRNQLLAKTLQYGSVSILENNPYMYLTEVIGVIQSDVGNGRVALWGCGYRGKLFIDALEKMKLKIDYVVDRDVTKQGRYYKNYFIHSYKSIQNEVDTILVLNDKYLKDVCSEAINKTVVSFSQYCNKKVRSYMNYE